MVQGVIWGLRVRGAFPPFSGVRVQEDDCIRASAMGSPISDNLHVQLRERRQGATR